MYLLNFHENFVKYKKKKIVKNGKNQIKVLFIEIRTIQNVFII